MQDISERFWSKVDRGSDHECWNWTAYRKRGYGTFRVADTKVMAHRFAYTESVGPIPDGHQVDHLCRNQSCCNPNHLEAVTPKENVLRYQLATGVGVAVTHCPSGHPYAGDNLYINPSGKRICRSCSRAAWRKWHRDRKESD